MSLCAAQDASIDSTQRRSSPAFNAERLSSFPTDEWITNGGNLANQRYSPLDLINRENVGELRAVWRASLQGSGVTPRGSNQAEPLYHDGLPYIATSENDVFALDGAIESLPRGSADPSSQFPPARTGSSFT